MDKIFHVEPQTPKRSSEDIEKDLRTFDEKYRKVVEAGWIVCITDNPMGLLSYGAMETIDLMGLPVRPEQLMVHLNTFHPKKELDEILTAFKAAGGEPLLGVSGDGSQRLHRLPPPAHRARRRRWAGAGAVPPAGHPRRLDVEETPPPFRVRRPRDPRRDALRPHGKSEGAAAELPGLRALSGHPGLQDPVPLSSGDLVRL